MNGVRLAAHHSNNRSDSRKLFSIRRSTLFSVVDEMAPICTTASSLRPSSQRSNSPAGTNSANRRPAKLRHFCPVPRISLTAMSVRPASFRLATTFEPMKPAPPVTNNIDAVSPLEVDPVRPPFAPESGGVQHFDPGFEVPLGGTGQAGPAKLSPRVKSNK